MNTPENQASDLLNSYLDTDFGGLVKTIEANPEPRQEDTRQRQSIKNWAEDDRPREKLSLKGAEALSDAELVAILLNSGTTERDAVEVARDLLKLSGNNLDRLGKMALKEYQTVSGIGPARAITLKAALELGHRRQNTAPDQFQLDGAESVYRYMGRYLRHQQTEQFWVLLISRANQVLRPVKIGDGGIAGVTTDQRIIFRHALVELASGIIVVHNHPSGNLKPSTEDDRLTQSIRQAGSYMNIPLLDHVIFTDRGFYSYADEGRL